MRFLAILTVGFFAATVTNAAAQFQITKPKSGDVCTIKAIAVEGIGASPGATVWLVVQPVQDGGLWSQRQANVVGANWFGRANLGQDDQHYGLEFRIFVLENPATSLAPPGPIKALPSADAVATVIVTKKDC